MMTKELKVVLMDLQFGVSNTSMLIQRTLMCDGSNAEKAAILKEIDTQNQNMKALWDRIDALPVEA